MSGTAGEPAEPGGIDPDVDLHDRGQARELPDAPWAVLSVIAAGGAIGGAARYAASVLLPTAPGEFPVATFLVNVSGCLLIGVLMVLVARSGPRLRLLRPFLGVGVLGGYTTFSTYVIDAQGLLDAERAATALVYLGGTLLCALAAVWAGTALAEAVLGRAGGGR
ncbi:fluoride efflux transporter CrcB [Nocardiopsis potens]|uniref:fluoride efflux transporter CrcB n=1 Tax=Nocardiopsis potens TaxID=1246458 RepID=UPI00034BC266|nr:fluoride efflux transporter CrcB [Nocardiopsis potens]